MATEDFFNHFDNEVEAQIKEKKEKEQKAQHYRDLTVVFIQKLKAVLKPYLEGLEKRGFRVEENENGAYYNVRVSDVMKGKSAQIGTTHSPYDLNDCYFILSDFEEFGRQTHIIDETFPKEKITSFVEQTLRNLI